MFSSRATSCRGKKSIPAFEWRNNQYRAAVLVQYLPPDPVGRVTYSLQLHSLELRCNHFGRLFNELSAWSTAIGKERWYDIRHLIIDIQVAPCFLAEIMEYKHILPRLHQMLSDQATVTYVAAKHGVGYVNGIHHRCNLLNNMWSFFRAECPSKPLKKESKSADLTKKAKMGRNL